MTCSSRISLSVRRRTKIKRLRGSNRGSIHDSCWKKPRRDRCTASPTAPGMAADFVCSRSWCGSRHLGSPQDNGMSAVYATRVSSQRRWRTPRFTGLIVPMFGSRIAEAKRGLEVFGEAEQVAEICQSTGPRRRELTADRIWCHRLAEAVAECPSVVNEQIDSYAHMQGHCSVRESSGWHGYARARHGRAFGLAHQPHNTGSHREVRPYPA